MRLLINLANADLVITFSGMSEILNNPDHIILTGYTKVEVNNFTICATNSPLKIMKSYLSSALVYFDAGIKEAKDCLNAKFGYVDTDSVRR